MKANPKLGRKPAPGELLQLYDQLSARVRGQPEVHKRLCEFLVRRELEAVPQRGPRGLFFFAGPTGVGKTETARCIADVLFGPGRLAFFDCSGIKTLEGVMSLIGNSNGDRGRFGAAHSQVPRGVWIFDEIEKGHSELAHLFLQLADTGQLMLASGEKLDLGGIYVLVTSNLGSAEILGRRHLPFATLERHVVRCVQRHLRPELLGRFGRPYVFRPLGREIQTEIAGQHLLRVIRWQSEAKGRHITFDQTVVSLLVQRGFSDRLGARPLLEILDELVGNAVVEDLASGGGGNGRLVVSGDRLQLIRS
jgi:ATP-dependent Clp protease ATP-binding subunit ClpA